MSVWGEKCCSRCRIVEMFVYQGSWGQRFNSHLYLLYNLCPIARNDEQPRTSERHTVVIVHLPLLCVEKSVQKQILLSLSLFPSPSLRTFHAQLRAAMTKRRRREENIGALHAPATSLKMTQAGTLPANLVTGIS